MKIGIINKAYFDLQHNIAYLEQMKRHGYDMMDYNMADTNDNIYQLNGEAFDAEVRRIRSLINEAGIEIWQTHGPWRYPPRDKTEEERAERFEKMSKAIRATKLLGADYFVIHPIMPFGPNENPMPTMFWEMNREFLTRLAKVGEEYGVIVCLENMPMCNLSLSKPVDILRMVREINSPYMKVCLDTGHCLVHGISPADAVRQIGKEYLAVMHIHDNDGERDCHWLPYTGVADWEEFCAALREIEYEGVLSLETHIARQMHLPQDIREPFEQAVAESVKYMARKCGE